MEVFLTSITNFKIRIRLINSNIHFILNSSFFYRIYASPLSAPAEENDEDMLSSSDEEFSRFCNCSTPGGNCLECRNTSSLYDFGDTAQPARTPILLRRSIRLQQLGDNQW